MITAESRPTLAAKARLRWDRQAERYMLLYPERGLVLNPEGSEWHEIERLGRKEDAASIGAEAGRELLMLAGPNFLSSLTPRL